jgi:hypothetical protein
MKITSTLAGASVLALLAVPALAGQPVFLGPYPALPTVLYDLDYAVSVPVPAGSVGPAADTIVSIGLGASEKVTGSCYAQVAWFDWDGAPAGLSGPPLDASGAPIPLAPGITFEYTTSTNGVPVNYPDFQENVFRNITSPSGSVLPFEGYAQVKIGCTTSILLKALRVDAEFVTRYSASTDPTDPLQRKTINVSKAAGIVGY